MLIHTLLTTILYLRATQGHPGGNTLILHCKTTCCYRATSPSTSTTLEAPTIFTIIQSGLIPGGKRCQEREACGVLQSRESNARRSTQRKGSRRDEVQNCSVQTKLENSQVCGFLKPPDSDERWKVRQHRAFSIPPEAPGIRQSDQSCRHEVWLHLDFC